MEVSRNGENKTFDINLMDFPFICRICLRRGDIKLLEQKDYLLDLFETIMKIDVRSTVNFPSNICHECINKLEDISLFINISKYNDSRPGNNIIPKKENEYVAIVDFGASKESVIKTEKTTEDEGDCTEKSEICRICLVPSCLTQFEEKAHLMQLFQNITNIDLEAACNFSSRNSICNKCINKLESISFFISLSLSNGVKIESAIRKNESLKTENCLEENSKFNIISDRKKVKLGNYFNESVGSYESKYLHTVVDIKEEIIHSLESPIRLNDQKGLESCSETNSVENLEYDSCEDEFGNKNHPKIISKEKEASLEAYLRMKQFKCDFCEKNFSLKNRLKRHLLIHSNNRPFKCDCCEKSFAYKNSLKRHFITHTGEKQFKCECCERSFSLKMNCQRHMLTHTGQKPFKCDCCEERFTQNISLRRHMLTHTGEKPFKCDICERSFTQVHHLRQHMLIHTGEKPFKCAICERSFTQLHHLKQHKLSHTGEKPFKCVSCEKGFVRKGDLQEHMLAHTGEKPFKCDSCQKGFTGKRILQRHMLTHTGVKPFKCGCCEKCFGQKCHLKQHMLTHTGEKLFKCDICEKSFTKCSNLKAHMPSHTREKPYKCDCCKKGFTSKRNLQRHIITHTG